MQVNLIQQQVAATVDALEYSSPLAEQNSSRPSFTMK